MEDLLTEDLLFLAPILLVGSFLLYKFLFRLIGCLFKPLVIILVILILIILSL